MMRREMKLYDDVRGCKMSEVWRGVEFSQDTGRKKILGASGGVEC